METVPLYIVRKSFFAGTKNLGILETLGNNLVPMKNCLVGGCMVGLIRTRPMMDVEKWQSCNWHKL